LRRQTAAGLRSSLHEAKNESSDPRRVGASGEGSGEQFVREQYPRELRALRAATVNAVLIVMIDGDPAAGPTERSAQLDASCRQFGIPPRNPRDRVALLVPKRNIETWLAYLSGATVNEADNYPRLDRPSDCKMHVQTLADMCGRRRLRQTAPPSLIAGCGEFRNLFP
jgi:hypothetical protein